MYLAPAHKEDMLRQGEIIRFLPLFSAEQQKMTAYRIRMDTTTAWAVSITGLLTVFILREENIPHWFFAFVFFLDGVFMAIESRHFSAFVKHRTRVRLLERGFYCKNVFQGTVDDKTPLSVVPDWEPKLKTAVLQDMSVH